MKRTAIITMLAILGSASVALADHPTPYRAPYDQAPPPVVERDHRWYDDDDDRFDRDDRGYDRRDMRILPIRQRGWIELGQAMQQGRGRSMITVNPRLRLERLRIQMDSSPVYVSSLIVRYTDGSVQRVVLDRWLMPRDHFADIELERRGVERVIVRGASRGSFKVFGYSTGRPMPRPFYPGYAR